MASIKTIILVVLLPVNIICFDGFGEAIPVKRGDKSWRIEQIYRNPPREKLWVSTFDEQSGIVISRNVAAVGKTESSSYLRISFDANRTKDILCSPGQELYVLLMHRFVPANRLRAGDLLFSLYQETVMIKSIELVKETLTIYALDAEYDHNYFVGYYGILAHTIREEWRGWKILNGWVSELFSKN